MEQHSKNYFAVITADILYNEDISIRQKLLMAIISNLSSEKGYCWASNTYLAKHIGVDERTVQRDISDLIRFGFVERVIKTKPNGEVDFRALAIFKCGMANTTPPPDGLFTTPHDRDVTKRMNSINNENNNTISVYFKINEQFEKFWELYDKKIDKKRCEKIWSKLKQEQIDKIFEVLPKYVEATKNEVQYRKHPTTWLRGECWNDAIPIQGRKTQSLTERYAHILPNIKLD